MAADLQQRGLTSTRLTSMIQLSQPSQHAIQSRPVRRRPAGPKKSRLQRVAAATNCRVVISHPAASCTALCTLHSAPRKIQLPEPARDFSREPPTTYRVRSWRRSDFQYRIQPGRPGFDPSIHFSIHPDPLPEPGAKTRISKRGGHGCRQRKGLRIRCEPGS